MTLKLNYMAIAHLLWYCNKQLYFECVYALFDVTLTLCTYRQLLNLKGMFEWQSSHGYKTDLKTELNTNKIITFICM